MDALGAIWKMASGVDYLKPMFVVKFVAGEMSDSNRNGAEEENKQYVCSDLRMKDQRLRQMVTE